MKGEFKHIAAMVRRRERQPTFLVWVARRQHQHLLQFQLREGCARKAEVAVMHRIERAAE